MSYRKISGRLLSAALTEAFGALDASEGYTTLYALQQDQDVPEDLVRALVCHLDVGLEPCDHSVGVCACSTRATVEELDLWLEGKTWCPACGGEGWVDVSTGDQDPRPERCERCHGKRTVSLPVDTD